MIRKSPIWYDVIIIGAGAAGLFCAAEAASRGRRVLVVDHATKIGEKIRISGGGRCNFTNIHTSPKNFISQNPKFCISALSGFTPQNFISRIEAVGIQWHEKKLGQLFCDESAVQIVDMLLDGCARFNVDVRTGYTVSQVSKTADGFMVEGEGEELSASCLVIATGGKSIPKIGATGFGYDIAKQFDLEIVETRAGLVPLTFAGDLREMASALSGVSIEASVTAQNTTQKVKQKATFQEGLLFTHRGLSGPSILQTSSYWRQGQPILINLCLEENIYAALKHEKDHNGRNSVETVLSQNIPKRLARALTLYHGWQGKLAEYPDKKLRQIAQAISNWSVTPAGSEGYRTAEVTLGGVDTKVLNSKTMEVKTVPGLYFIGEVVDVTGWLGGYNFQWAWASGYAAGQAIV